MARSSRDEQMLAAVRRVADQGEAIVDRGPCWVATRRAHVPLLVLGRHQYDAVITDRRLVLFSRRRRHRRGLHARDVVLVKRFESLALDAQRDGVLLLQQRIHTDTGSAFVLEWPQRSRRIGRALGGELPRSARRTES